MKKFLLFFLCISFGWMLQAQVSKTVNVTAGGLYASLTETERNTITELILTGTIDARDFKTMRDRLPLLKELNISNTSILAYNGSGGTSDSSMIYYPANTIPEFAFRNVEGISKTSLNSVLFPTTLTSFGILAFSGCTGLNSIIIPPSVVTVGREAFAGCTGLISLDIPPSIKSIGETSFFNTGLTTLTIPSTVTSIQNNAFYGCRQLTTLSILTTSTSIGRDAFGFCDRLISITVPWTDPPYLEQGIFVNSNISACTLHVPWGSALKYKLLNWHGFINIVEPTDVLSASSAKVTSTAGSTASIDVTTEGSWTASSDQSWLVVSPASGTGKQKLTFTAAANTSVGSRTATITVTAGNTTMPVTITQTGADVILMINPGSLITSLTSEEQKVITNLTLKGNMDARDFKTIRDEMPLLTSLDLSAVNIVAYEGIMGTINNSLANYPANTIPENAFYNYFTPSGTINNLVTIVLPQSITGIGNYAFWYGLTALKVFSPEPILMSYYNTAFSSITENCTLYVPYKSALYYKTAEKWKEFRTIEEASAGFILSTYNDTIAGAEGTIHTAEINANVNWSIRSDQDWLTVSPASGNGSQTITFKAKANELLIKRKATVTITGEGVFAQTTTITQDIQPQPEKILEVTAGGLEATLTQDELNTISILTLTGTIDARDFKTMRDKMPLLAKLDLSGVNIVAYSGTGGTSLNYYINYPANTIPETAFYGRNPLTDSYVGKTSLTSVVLPSNLVSLGYFAFAYCSGITDVLIPSSVTSIGGHAFYYCKGLTSVSIPSSVETIGNSAFWYCTSLSSVILPSSVTSLGSSAFANCGALTSLTVNWTVPLILSIYQEVFRNSNIRTVLLNVPYGTLSRYAAAEQWKDFPNKKEMPGFLLSANNTTIEAMEGSTSAVEILSNVSWSATSDQTWLAVSPTNGNGLEQKLTFTAEANARYSPRIAKVTVSSPGLESQIVTITQKHSVARVEVSAGGLSSVLTAEELNSIIDLTLTGTIDARDFKTMREMMPLLTNVDLSGAIIAAYSGSEGTNWGSIDYPANEIPEYAFYKNMGTTTLTSILFPQSITSIGSYAFYNCAGLTDILIPSMVTTIEQEAFCYCSGLKSVSLPSSVISLGTQCFSNCSNLNSITVDSSIPPTLNPYSYVFYQVDKSVCVLNVPFKSAADYRIAYQWRDFQNIKEAASGFNVSSNKVRVDGVAGSSATIIISSNMEWTANSDQEWLVVNPMSGNDLSQALTFTAEENPSFLNPRIAYVTVSAPGTEYQRITITQSNRIQPPKTFEVTAGGLASLLSDEELATITDLTLMGTIDARDFKILRDQMPLLSILNLSDVKIVAYNGIEGTSRIGNIDYPENTVPEYAFVNTTFGLQGKSSLTSVLLPKSLTAIGQYSFSLCQSLTNVIIPISVTDIGSFAFYGCRSISEITIPSAVTTIGLQALGYLIGAINVVSDNPSFMSNNNVLFNKAQTQLIQSSGLNSGNYVIPSTVTTIGDCAFSDCYRLTSVTIPSSVTSIGNYAFSFSSGITTITIPSSVTYIGESAFARCNGLRSIYSNSITPVDLSASPHVFYMLLGCTLYVPVGSKTAYQQANQWKDFWTIVEINPDLIAFAGPDIEIKEGAWCLLTGSATVNTSGQPLTYQWTAPEGITLSSATEQFPTFTAPEVNEYTQLTFSLIVSDGLNTSTPDQVSIFVSNVNKPPVAKAGPDQTVNEGSQVTLDGSASFDPDNDYFYHEWIAPYPISLNSAYTAKPTFKTPNVSYDTPYIFYLRISDGYSTQTDTVVITVRNINQVPVAHAGDVQIVNEGETVTLNATRSTDADGDALTYKWTAPEGITLSSLTSPSPSFTAPSVASDMSYIFKLVVNDGKVNSVTAQANVVVKNIPTFLTLMTHHSKLGIPVNYQLYWYDGIAFVHKRDTFSVTGDTLRVMIEPGYWIGLVAPAKDPAAFVPTWSGNVLNWEEAEVINIPVNGAGFIGINGIVPPAASTGVGQVAGFVYEKPGDGTKSISVLRQENLAINTPVQTVLVQLYKKGSSIPVASVFTDKQGAYLFDQLAVADYEIGIEIPGYHQSERFPVTLTDIAPSTQVWFGVDNSSKVITDHPSWEASPLKVYPNPTKGVVYISGLPESEGNTISVYSIDGRTVMGPKPLTEGKVDLSNQVPGIYLLMVNKERFRIVKK